LIVVFGASFIKDLLVERIIAKGALNIHMGISPYYRGSSCNFWALYDGNPDLVGATIHLISKGLDSGGMLYHARPKSEPMDPFVLGMRAVEAAQDSLVERGASGAIKGFAPVAQKAEEIRYSRNAEFTDTVAAEYLARGLTAEKIGAKLKVSAPRQFLNLFQPAR
jgi:methionyl-tRNA formyltransferase